MANLHPFKHFKHARFTLRTSFARSHGTQFGPLINRNVTKDIHAAKVVIVFVCARRHVATILQRRIGNDAQVSFRGTCFIFCADASQTSGACTEKIANLFGVRGTYGSCAQTVSEFGFVQLMIAAK